MSRTFEGRGCGGRYYDLTGGRFGRWTVIERANEIGERLPLWRVRCDCGAERFVVGRPLRDGSSRSCGCIRNERTAFRNLTHGLSKSPEHRVWSAMKKRCLNPRDSGFKNYGGRGITVDPRWLSFEAFISDMGRRPPGRMTLERIDNDGPYAPWNCRWATYAEQRGNTRPRKPRRLFAAFGLTLPVREWAALLSVSSDALRSAFRVYGTVDVAGVLVRCAKRRNGDDTDRVKSLAESYLRQRGIALPEAMAPAPAAEELAS